MEVRELLFDELNKWRVLTNFILESTKFNIWVYSSLLSAGIFTNCFINEENFGLLKYSTFKWFHAVWKFLSVIDNDYTLFWASLLKTPFRYYNFWVPNKSVLFETSAWNKSENLYQSRRGNKWYVGRFTSAESEDDLERKFFFVHGSQNI